MVDEAKLKEYVEDTCREVVSTKEWVDFTKADFARRFASVQAGNNLNIGSLPQYAENLKTTFIEYQVLRFQICRLCHALGPEYISIYDEICGKALDS